MRANNGSMRDVVYFRLRGPSALRQQSHLLTLNTRSRTSGARPCDARASLLSARLTLPAESTLMTGFSCSIVMSGASICRRQRAPSQIRARQKS
jgi:hypothetical protein